MQRIGLYKKNPLFNLQAQDMPTSSNSSVPIRTASPEFKLQSTSAAKRQMALD